MWSKCASVSAGPRGPQGEKGDKGIGEMGDVGPPGAPGDVPHWYRLHSTVTVIWFELIIEQPLVSTCDYHIISYLNYNLSCSKSSVLSHFIEALPSVTITWYSQCFRHMSKLHLIPNL